MQTENILKNMRYQDTWINGTCIEKGKRDCEERYNSIKNIFKYIKNPVVLDFGAQTGYFSFRLFEDFTCNITSIECDQSVKSIYDRNNSNVKLINKLVAPDELCRIIKDQNINTVLLLSVLHNNKNWKEFYDIVLENVENIFVETPYEYENQTINNEIYIDIKNQIESQFYQKLTEQYNIQKTYKRPLLYISKNRYNTTGTVQDGTGHASKHTIFWREEIQQLTNESIIDGTLNVKCDHFFNLSSGKEIPNIQNGIFKIWKCKINDLDCYLVRPPLASWPYNVLEFVSKYNLRKILELTNGQSVNIEIKEFNNRRGKLYEGSSFK